MIQVQGLTRRYGDTVAVSGLSFSVQEGEIVGFLGPNGAGKTTTMNMITACARPQAPQCSAALTSTRMPIRRAR